MFKKKDLQLRSFKNLKENLVVFNHLYGKIYSGLRVIAPTLLLFTFSCLV